MEAGKFSFKFSRQTQKNLVGSSKYAYFSATTRFFNKQAPPPPEQQKPLKYVTKTSHVTFLVFLSHSAVAGVQSCECDTRRICV
jgi:hypothetical protein